MFTSLEFDLQKGIVDTVLLLLTPQDAEPTPEGQSEEPAVQVWLPPELSCIMSYPREFCETESGVYLPSVRIRISWTGWDPLYKAFGILHIRSIRGSDIFILWGVEKYSTPISDTSWCQIIDREDAIGIQTQNEDVRATFEFANDYIGEWNNSGTPDPIENRPRPGSEDVRKISDGYCTARIEEAAFFGQRYLKLELSLSILAPKKPGT